MADVFEVWSIAELAPKILGRWPANAYEWAQLKVYATDVLKWIPTTAQQSQFAIPAGYFAEAAGASQALTVSGGSAASAFAQYEAAGHAVSAYGAAGGNALVTQGAQMGFSAAGDAASTSGYVFKPSALLAVELPTAAAAIAPLAGVALGYAWYNQNPELWTKISQRLLPFCYDDTTLIPTWAEFGEAVGQLVVKALIPAFIVDAIKSLFEEEGIGPSGTQGSLVDVTISGAQYYAPIVGEQVGVGSLFKRDLISDQVVDVFITELTATAPVYATTIVTSPNTYSVYLFSSERFTGRAIGYYPGTSSVAYSSRINSGSINTVSGYGPVTYRGFQSTYGGPAFTVYQERVLSSVDYYNIGAIIIYGAPTSSGYPAGTSPYGTGQPYPLPQNPEYVVIGEDPDTGDPILQPAYPLPMPITPGASPSSEEQSIDDPIVDPTSQIDPWVMPTPVPGEEVGPSLDPVAPSPEDDPSTLGDPTVQPEPTPEPEPQPEPEPEAPISPTSPDPPPDEGETDDPLPPISLPPFGANGGLISVYNPTQSELLAFSNWLWVTYQDATIDKIWNNPFDGIVSLHELYSTPTITGRKNIRSGFLDSGVASDTVGRYSELNCGNIVIPEYWGNYLDYSPYSKAFVCLPFIGIVELEADDIVGHAVNITYRIDAYNGSCIAMITVAKRGADNNYYSALTYQYSGNCAVELPLTGGTQATIKAAITQATIHGLGSVISGAVTALASPGAIGAISGIAEMATGAANAAASVLSAKSSVFHSGSFGSSFGAMGPKKPFIIVKRPIQVRVYNYNEVYGYQAHKAVTIGSCRGYLRCREVHVESATANNAEKLLIEQLLKSGVYVTE